MEMGREREKEMQQEWGWGVVMVMISAVCGARLGLGAQAEGVQQKAVLRPGEGGQKANSGTCTSPVRRNGILSKEELSWRCPSMEPPGCFG